MRHSEQLNNLGFLPAQFLVLCPREFTPELHLSFLPLPLPPLYSAEDLWLPLREGEDIRQESHNASLSPTRWWMLMHIIFFRSVLMQELSLLLFKTLPPGGCGLSPPASHLSLYIPSFLSAHRHFQKVRSVSIPFQTEPTFFYFLCFHLVTSLFFLSSVQPGIYLCFCHQGSPHWQTEWAPFSPHFTWSPVASGSDQPPFWNSPQPPFWNFLL